MTSMHIPFFMWCRCRFPATFADYTSDSFAVGFVAHDVGVYIGTRACEFGLILNEVYAPALRRCSVLSS